MTSVTNSLNSISEFISGVRYILGTKRMESLEDLKPYLGKVVKFQNGDSCQYFYVDQFVYSDPNANYFGPNANFFGKSHLIGVKCHSENQEWNRRLVGTSILFTEKSFQYGYYVINDLSSGRFGQEERYQQSWFETASYDEFAHRSFAGVAGDGKLSPEHASNKGKLPQLPKPDSGIEFF